MDDPTLIATLKEKQVPIETCFTSNLQTKATKNTESYPICYFLEQGLFVTVNTDNMTVSGTDLRKEYCLLQKTFGLSEGVLRQIACNAADAAFLPYHQKLQLKETIAKNFSSWLQKT